MKNISFSIILLFYGILLNAQDTIIKINGDRIVAKINEISATEIKYKKFDFQDGPTYIESKSNIQLILFSNGSREEFTSQAKPPVITPMESSADYYSGPPKPSNKIESFGNHFRYREEFISEKTLHDVLFKSKDKQIILLAGNAKDAKKLQYVGFGAIPLGVGALYFLTRGIFNSTSYYGQSRAQTSRDFTFSTICFMGAVACPIASGYFKHKRNVSNRQAIKLYNERY